MKLLLILDHTIIFTEISDARSLMKTLVAYLIFPEYRFRISNLFNNNISAYVTVSVVVVLVWVVELRVSVTVDVLVMVLVRVVVVLLELSETHLWQRPWLLISLIIKL